jgi:hypothetical protein
MSMFMKEELAEILRQAIAAYGAKIVELQAIRAQLVQLIEKSQAYSPVEINLPKTRSGLSAEARAKISAAQKARWARDRKERVEEQPSVATEMNVTIIESAPIPVKRRGRVQKPKPAPLKAKLIKAASVPVKENVEPQIPEATQSTPLPSPTAPEPERSLNPLMEKGKATFRVSAKKPSAPRREEIRTSQSSKPELVTPAGIVEQLALAGARFRITRGGSLIVGNLASLPPALQQMFINYPNPHLLTAAARRHMAGGGQASGY